MITRDNLKEVIFQISEKDKRRILKTFKEFTVLKLHVFNSGSYTEVILTDNYTKFQNVGNNGNCILDTQEIINILKNN